jgi:hypothetical protein
MVDQVCSRRTAAEAATISIDHVVARCPQNRTRLLNNALAVFEMTWVLHGNHLSVVLQDGQTAIIDGFCNHLSDIPHLVADLGIVLQVCTAARHVHNDYFCVAERCSILDRHLLFPVYKSIVRSECPAAGLARSRVNSVSRGDKHLDRRLVDIGEPCVGDATDEECCPGTVLWSPASTTG